MLPAHGARCDLESLRPGVPSQACFGMAALSASGRRSCNKGKQWYLVHWRENRSVVIWGHQALVGVLPPAFWVPLGESFLSPTVKFKKRFHTHLYHAISYIHARTCISTSGEVLREKPPLVPYSNMRQHRHEQTCGDAPASPQEAHPGCVLLMESCTTQMESFSIRHIRWFVFHVPLGGTLIFIRVLLCQGSLGQSRGTKSSAESFNHRTFRSGELTM